MRLLTILALCFLAVGCSDFELKGHTPNVNAQDDLYRINAGTDDHDMICSEEEQRDGDCG